MEYLLIILLIVIYPYFKVGAEELILDIVSILLIPVKLFIFIRESIIKWRNKE